MGILFPLLLAYTNGVRAVRKGHSMWLWTVVSFIAYMLTGGAGVMLLLAAFYKGDWLDTRAQTAFFEESTLRSVTALMAGIGGYLAVRYTIDHRLVARKQDKGGDEFPEG